MRFVNVHSQVAGAQHSFLFIFNTTLVGILCPSTVRTRRGDMSNVSWTMTNACTTNNCSSAKVTVVLACLLVNFNEILVLRYLMQCMVIFSIVF